MSIDRPSMKGEYATPPAYPCGMTRRECVWEMGAGFAGVALAGLLGADGFRPTSAAGDDHSTTSSGPLAPKPGRHPARATSVIFLMMNGAPQSGRHV